MKKTFSDFVDLMRNRRMIDWTYEPVDADTTTYTVTFGDGGEAKPGESIFRRLFEVDAENGAPLICDRSTKHDGSVRYTATIRNNNDLYMSDVMCYAS